MMTNASLRAFGLFALTLLGHAATGTPAFSQDEPCIDCISIRVGPAITARGPFPDELDAAFTALRLADGTFRGFSANGATYAIDSASLMDMNGPRRAVMEPGAPGSINDCGRWLTSTLRSSGNVLGFVHQERDCDYERGRTGKSMAVAISADDGLSWTDLGTVITGSDTPQPDRITGEGDCTMVDGFDGYLYGYCLRNSDWQTIVARAPVDEPTEWRKYYQGAWSEPGLGGQATDIGFVGTGSFFLKQSGLVAAIATDPWFGGLRLSLSRNKVDFVDVTEPLVAIDGAEWDRPADTDLLAYATALNPEDGSNLVNDRFLLSYLYVPEGKGFESRYLVQREVTMSWGSEPQAAQVGVALTRWVAPDRPIYVTTTAALPQEALSYRREAVVAYMLTSAPDGVASIKFSECSQERGGQTDRVLAEDGECAAVGYARERTAGWLYAAEQPGTVPVYRCHDQAAAQHFASSQADCEGLGMMKFRLGYGLAP